MTIFYEIHFLSDWHCGSGLGVGAEADAAVLKDDSLLPYMPGKTIKGLLKDALIELSEFDRGIQEELIGDIFGYEVYDAEEPDKVIETRKGMAFFSNASLSDEERKEISKELARGLYRTIASTQISSKTGTAKPKSLRMLEVCMPVSLQGHIDGLEEKHVPCIRRAMQWVRAIGVNRNRGLGRCKFLINSKTIENE